MAEFLKSKMDPKSDPNRIFDGEALRKPLGGLLERSWKLLEPKKVSQDRSPEASWAPKSPPGTNRPKRTDPLTQGNPAPRGGGKGEGILWKSLPLRGEVVSQPATP